jgi:hypothetical protein
MPKGRPEWLARYRAAWARLRESPETRRPGERHEGTAGPRCYGCLTPQAFASWRSTYCRMPPWR